MKTFGKRERDGTPTRVPALTPRRDELPTEQLVMPAVREGSRWADGPFGARAERRCARAQGSPSRNFVELRGIEPLTSALRTQRSPS